MYISRFNPNNDGDLIVDLRALPGRRAADVHPGRALASVTVPAASVQREPGRFFAVDFSGANLQVTQGEQLAVVLHVRQPAGGQRHLLVGRRHNNSTPAGGSPTG